jgi:hypothetical protein
MGSGFLNNGKWERKVKTKILKPDPLFGLFILF